MEGLDLVRQLEERGYKGRVVPAHHIHDLREEFEEHYKQGLIDEGLRKEYLSSFAFDLPASLPEARSLIVVAVPQPQVRFIFSRDGKSLSTLVPPTYVHAAKTDESVKDALAEMLAPDGYRVELAALPKKLTAVRSGLAAYGKNNITYVPGMGSFHRPVVLYSDLPCREDGWRDSEVMAACENCSACLRNCPVEAISSDRFLLHAERCIVYHNEMPGDVPFPAWIDAAWHNSLVGCMRCQNVCPENKDFWQWVEEGTEFSEEETELLLEGVSLDRLSAAIREKLERADLARHADLLPRNLSALFAQ